MNIAKFAVSQPVTNFMRIGAFVLMGLVCLTKLSVDLLPKVSLPTISVSTDWPNVAPEEIESQVTRPIEEALSSINNLYAINSNTMEGNSSVRVQFQWGTDIGQAAVDTLQLVERARRNFPTNDTTLAAPLVFKFDPTSIPILSFAVSGVKDSVKLRMLMDNQISPIVESANGVAAATVTGGDKRAIIVNIDPIRMSAYNLSLNTVVNRLIAENINLPAGVAKQGETEYTVRSLGWFTSVKDIGNTPITAPNGQVVRLGDVASIHDLHAETRILTRVNGDQAIRESGVNKSGATASASKQAVFDQAVGLTITKQSDSNTIETKKAVFEKLALVKKLYPNIHFKVAYDQAIFIQQSISDLGWNALIGGFLAVLILLFFLRNVRSTLVVATSIPASIISTFGMLYVCGFTINTMSLGGISLATGLIVDDAVVVLENIFRHIERDKQTPRDAAINGTSEIVSAVFASTWTVMVVFIPLLLIIIFVFDQPEHNRFVSKDEAMEAYEDEIAQGVITEDDVRSGNVASIASKSRKTDVPFGQILRTPGYIPLVFVYIAAQLAYWGVMSWSAQYLTQVHGFSVMRMGVWASIYFIGGALGAFASGWVSDKILGGRRKPMIILCFVCMIPFIVILATLTKGVSEIVLLLTLTGAGFFSNMVWGPAITLPADMFPVETYGKAIGGVNCIAYMAAAASPYIMGWLISVDPVTKTVSYFNAWIWVACTALIGVAAGCMLVDKKKANLS